MPAKKKQAVKKTVKKKEENVVLKPSDNYILLKFEGYTGTTHIHNVNLLHLMFAVQKLSEELKERLNLGDKNDYT